MDGQRDYYEILGVSKNASAEEIKRAYRRKALEWHPDKHKGDGKRQAEQKFKEINQAYEVLRDSQKRQAYDQFGPDAFKQGTGFGAGGPFSQTYRQGPFTYTYTTSGGGIPFEDIFGGFSDPFEIFEEFFGTASPFARSYQRKPVYSLAIDFLEASRGVEKEVSIAGKRKKVKIPAGVGEGSRIRFSDFDILIQVRPHEKFQRQGQDIFLDFPISFTQAALGDTVAIPTLDGKVKLKIRPGTQTNTLVRLRGRGIPYPHSRNRGDQYVRLQVKIPKNLTRKQKQLLEEFEILG